VGVTGSRFAYQGDGVNRAFAFPRLFLSSTDLVVVKRTDAGVETLLTQGIHYTVSGAGNINGGTVTLVTAPKGPPQADVVVIWRATPRLQQFDLRDGGAFSSENVEAALDKLYLIVDDLVEQLSRAAQVGMGGLRPASMNLPIPTPGKILAWNDTASGFMNREPQEWLQGSGAPAGALGSVGDFYVNVITGDYYLKTGVSYWEMIGTIKGATGAQGEQGPQGPPGNPWGVTVQTGTFSSSVALTYQPGVWNRINLTANVTSFTISGWPAAPTGARMILEVHPATYSINAWPTNIKWPNDAQPELSTGADATDLIVLTTSDGGTTVLGSVVAYNYA
jgi:hypothetical protein